MRPFKRAVHLDFHTMPGIYDFGSEWDAERFADTLEKSKVKYINMFAKCNLGFAYYPTKIGVPYPNMKGDMFGEALKACHKRGIGVTAYFNLGLDHEQARLHREWCIVNQNGTVMGVDKLDSFFRMMCLNSGYQDHILGMIREVCESYDIDGIFLDCVDVRPCCGNECVEAMLKRGLNPLRSEQVQQFTEGILVEFAGKVKSIVGGDRYLMLNNWRDTMAIPQLRDNTTHIELECLPDTWGSDFFDANAAIARELKDNVIYMTGRFRDWGDFGSLRTRACLEFDMWDALSCGAEFSIGDHLHPRGRLEPELYDVIKDLYTDLERYEKWTYGTKYVADVGVLTDLRIQEEWYQGISRILGELKVSFNFLHEDSDFSSYKLLIIPDNIRVSDKVKAKLELYLKQGKRILSTGEGGLKTDGTGFALSEYGFEYCGMDENGGFFRLPDDLKEHNSFRYSMYLPGILIKAAHGCTISGYIKPYFNKHWDGMHGYVYAPPDRESGYAAIANNKEKNICHICFKVFTAYRKYAVPAHKKAVGYCISQLLERPSLLCEELPSTARVSLTANDKHTLVHIKASFADRRWNNSVIEEHQELTRGRVKVLGKFQRAQTAEGAAVELKQEGDYAVFDIPNVKGYRMIILEK